MISVNRPLRASPLPLPAAALSAPVLTSLPAEQRARSTALARLAGSTGADTPPPAPNKSQCWKWLSQFELQLTPCNPWLARGAAKRARTAKPCRDRRARHFKAGIKAPRGRESLTRNVTASSKLNCGGGKGKRRGGSNCRCRAQGKSFSDYAWAQARIRCVLVNPGEQQTLAGLSDVHTIRAGRTAPGIVGAGNFAEPGIVGAGNLAEPGIVGAGNFAEPGIVGAGNLAAPGINLRDARFEILCRSFYASSMLGSRNSNSRRCIFPRRGRGSLRNTCPTMPVLRLRSQTHRGNTRNRSLLK